MIHIQSGARHNSIDFPKGAEVTTFKTEGIPVLVNWATEIENAFKNSIGATDAQGYFLSKNIHGQVVIAVTETAISENLEIILTSTLTHLYKKNTDLKPSAITIIVDEAINLNPELNHFKKLFKKMVASGCRVIVHDPILQKMTNLGTTNGGTPVWVNSEFAATDLKIIIDLLKPSPLFGLIESPLRLAHCFMSIDTIESLEKLTTSLAAENKVSDLHPMLDELEEIRRMVNLDGVIACLCNPGWKPIQIMAGDPVAQIHEAKAIYQRHYCISARFLFDIVVINFGPHYSGQFSDLVQRGLLLAAHMLKEGGQVLIMGENTEGIGDDISFDYICHSLSPAALIKEFITSRIQSRGGGIRYWNRQNDFPAENLKFFFSPEVIYKCQFRATDPSMLLTEWANGYESPPRLAVIPDGSNVFYRPL